LLFDLQAALDDSDLPGAHPLLIFGPGMAWEAWKVPGNRVFFRGLATRGSRELPEHLSDVIAVVKAAGSIW
jgi:hypothetical protein